MTELERLLEANRPALEAALVEAKAELRELDERRERLVALINRTRAALGEPAVPIAPKRLTLHEAIKQVLEENGNHWMSVRELADEINRRGLYAKKDGTPIEPSQIHARTKNYEPLFEKNGPEVRLRKDRA